jgi:hypothetical protein
MVACVYFVRESVDGCMCVFVRGSVDGCMCVFCERVSGWLDVCIL